MYITFVVSACGERDIVVTTSVRCICVVRGGRVVRWCLVIFQCRGVLLIWIRVRQGLTVLAVGAGGGCLDIFSLVYHFSILSSSLWETARYRLKYCLKGPLSPKQPTYMRCACEVRCACAHLSGFVWAKPCTFMHGF